MRFTFVEQQSSVHPPFILRRLAVVFAGLGIVICAFAGSARAGTHAARRAAGVPVHVETWGYDDGCDGGAGVSSALVRRWLTYAESACGPNTRKARADCHGNGRIYCHVMQYLDTDWDFPGGDVPLSRNVSAAWWLHEPRRPETPLFSNSFGGGYLFNQTNSAVQTFFRSYVRRHYNADDGLMMDWQSASLSMELYYSTCGCTSTHEIRSSAALRRAHEEMSAAITHRDGTPFMQADVSLPPNPFLPQGLDMLSRATGVTGLVTEGYPEENGTLDLFYSTLLDQIAYVDYAPSAYVVLLSHGAAGAAYQARSRRVQEATMLLGYRRGHLVDWADLEQGSSDIALWPEEGIYPTRPIQSMRAPRGRGCLAGTGTLCARGGHNNVQVARGVYRREFRECYNRGVPFGACAAIVNTRSRAVRVRSSWLRRKYRHEITFVGRDVQSGGKIDQTGARFRVGATRVGAHDAVLLAR